MARAASEVLGAELSGSSRYSIVSSQGLHRVGNAFGPRPLAAPGISAELDAALLAGAHATITGYIGQSGGQLRVSASEQNAATGKMIAMESASGPISGGITPLLDRIAKKFGGQTRAYSTRNEQALAAFAQALELPPAESGAAYERATAADPNFGAAWVGAVRAAAARQDRASEERVLAEAKVRGAGIDELNRAYLDLDEAALKSPDLRNLRDALAHIARLTPNDANNTRALADSEMAGKHFPDAISHYQRALELQPRESGLWNSLGYAQLFNGDDSGAIKSFSEYQRLLPGQANPLDCIGDAHYRFGRFDQAENYYLQAFAKDAAFQEGADLYKAAQARRMTGDVDGATKLFDRFALPRRSPANLIDLLRAEWTYSVGDVQTARQQIAQFAERTLIPPQWRAQALAEAAMWDLIAGDRDAALRHSQNTPGLIRKIVTGETENDPHADAFRLLLTKGFAAAAPIWKTIVDESPATQAEPPVLYAWALVETGRELEAAPLVSVFPLPAMTVGSGLQALAFPRIFYLRGKVFDKQGKAAEAAKASAIFQKLSATPGRGD